MTNLTVYSGNTIVLIHTITNAAGTAQDLTGCTLFSTLKYQRTDADGAALASINSPSSGIVISSPASAGFATSTYAASVTASFTSNTRLEWDLKLKDATGAVYTVDSGQINVILEVTNRTS